MIPQNIIDRIINDVDIVDTVSSYLPLTPKGKNYLAVCPFHNDTNPSMSVSREKKFFKCFSCGTSGNVIQFVSKYENIPYGEACKKLALKLGIVIESENNPEKLKHKRYYRAMDEAVNFYQFYLQSSTEGVTALDYLTKRGISKDIIADFKIGLAPSASNYLNMALNEKNIDIIDQMDVGLVGQGSNGDSFDIFRSRIIFPVADTSGQVVGLSGRVFLPNDKSSKYMNSPENAIFHKGEVLYNYKNASMDARRLDTIYIFEGFMDVIAARRAGINNAVATMGTALTKAHLKAIMTLTKNIVLCFDGDAAGINATKKAVEIFATTSILPQAVALPDNLDPDEFLERFGPAALAKYLKNNTVNVYDYLYTVAKSKMFINDINSVEQFKKDIFALIKKAKSSTISEFYLNKLSDDLNIDVNRLITDLGKVDVIKVTRPEESPKKQKLIKIPKKVFLAYDNIIRYSLLAKKNFAEYFNYIGEDKLYLSSEFNDYYPIIIRLVDYYQIQETLEVEPFVNSFGETSPEYALLKRIISYPFFEPNNQKVLEDSIKTIKLYIESEAGKLIFQEALKDDEKMTEYIDHRKKMLR